MVRLAPVVYYALVVPGVEAIAAAELRSAGADVLETIRPRDKRESVIAFRIDDAARVMRCGTLEDIFQIVLDVPLAAGARTPKAASEQLDRAMLERALVTHHALRPRRAGRSYKVVARMSGRHAFLREDVEYAWTRLLDHTLAHWVARDPATIEVWVHAFEDRMLAGLRLSADDFGQRRWKTAHLPASLKPTVARALVMLSGPTDNEVVLDPMCGAGTILRERADAGRAAMIIGGDIDAGALDAAAENAGKSAMLARWDATRLPLRGASVDVIVTNPPYGRQHEAIAGLDRLYARSLRESARVLRPGGLCVVLTGEPGALMRATPPALRLRSKHRLTLRGLAVVAFVLARE